MQASDGGHEGVLFPGGNEERVLALDECLALLDAHRVGRIAILTDVGPVIVPVNYRLVRSADLRWIAFRTRLGGILDRTSLHVAFEIDQIDDAERTGWSVLVRGTLQHVDPDAAEFGVHHDSEPWVMDRDAWLIIQPYIIEGRRLEPRAASAVRRQR